MRIGNQELMKGAMIKNFRPEVLAADPDVATLVAEQRAIIWFNSTENKFKFFTGSEIKIIGDEVILPKDLIRGDGSVPMTADLELASSDQSKSDDKAAVSKGHVASVVSDAVGKKQDKLSGLTQDTVVLAGEGNSLVTSSVTKTELGYLSGTKSAVQTQLDGKLSADSGKLTGDLNADGHTITNLGAPVNSNDVARKVDIDNAISGMNWQEDVDNVQTDATLQPSKANKSRYILTDITKLHADFGTIANAANNCIVQADSTGVYSVVFDPAGARAQGAIAWSQALQQYVRYDGTSWSQFGGMAAVTAGNGLNISGNSMNVQTDRGLTIVDNKVGVSLADNTGIVINSDGNVATLLDGTSLAVSASGIKIAAAGVGYTQLSSSAFGNGLKQNADKNTIDVDLDALRTATFLDSAGGNATQITLTGDAKNYTDKSAVAKAYVDTAVGKYSTAARVFTLDKTADADVAATVFTFTHNAGTRLGAVTVTDETGYKIIPDEIVFVDKNTLRVELTEAKKIAIAFVTDGYNTPAAQ